MRLLRFWLLILAVGLMAGCATSKQNKAWEADIARGDVAMSKHDFKNARDAYSAAVDKAGHFSSKDPRLAQSIGKLAALSFADRQYLEAKTLSERVLKLEEKRLGSTNSALADQYVRLAEVDEAMKLYEEADRFYQKASELVENGEGISTPVIGVYMARRARLAGKMEQYELACALYDRAIKFIEDAQFNLSFSPQLADERAVFLLETARTRNEFGLLCTKLEKYEDAEKLFIRASDTLEAQYTRNSPNLAPVYLNLAKVYVKEEKLEDAIIVARKALRIAEKSMADDHPITVEIREFVRNAEMEQEQGKQSAKKNKD